MTKENKTLDFLDTTAAGLDLNDLEDRAIFRQRVARRFRATTVECINGWTGGAARVRAAAVRALADKYIAEGFVPPSASEWPCPRK